GSLYNFFFSSRRRHTRSKRDWSSDVYSSDLPPRIMDLGLLARALKERQIDLAAGNTTDGLIPALDLFVLEDDRHYFPPYEAIPIIRQEAAERHPEVMTALQQLASKISDEQMRNLNYAVDGQHRDVKAVVQELLQSKAP